MLRTLALVVALSTPALAETNGWVTVHKLGYSYLMPPVSCMGGPLPPHQTVYVPQSDLDDGLPPNHPPGIHFFGTHVTVNGEPVEYISEDLPWAVSIDVQTHEDAHLRGCEHGNEWGPD